MKVKTSKHDNFKPFDITITIETEDEAHWLMELMPRVKTEGGISERIEPEGAFEIWGAMIDHLNKQNGTN